MIDSLFYWMWAADALGAIQVFSGVAAIVGASFFGIFTAVIFMDNYTDEDDVKKWKRVANYGLPSLLVAGLLATAIPSQRTIYTYIALSTGAEIATVSGLDGTANKALTLLNQKLDEMLEEDEE